MTTTAALNEDQLETLALFLEDQAEDAEGLDFFALHGLLTANAVSPKTLSIDALIPMIFNGVPQWPKDSVKAEIISLISLLQKEVIELVESGQSFPVPCDLNVEGDEDGEAAPLENWAIGFILLSIEQHKDWYGKHEENAAELLFPIVYASGLNAEDDAFADIDDDEQLSLQVCASIPDNLIDLFLLYNGDES
ncbi:YecA/YgfB family protein [Pseudomonas sp. HK3]